MLTWTYHDELSLSCLAIQSTHFASINDPSGYVKVHINSYYSPEPFVFNTSWWLHTQQGHNI